MRRGMGMWWRGEGMEVEEEAVMGVEEAVMEAEAEAGRMEVIAFHVIAFHAERYGWPRRCGARGSAGVASRALPALSVSRVAVA